MKRLQSIIDTHYPYKLPFYDRCEDKLLEFQLPEEDENDFLFYNEGDEVIFTSSHACADPKRMFEAMVSFNVLFVLDCETKEQMWKFLVNLNLMKFAAMRAQHLLHEHFAVDGVAPYFRQFVVAVPESPDAVEFFESYIEWVRLAEELSILAESWRLSDYRVLKESSSLVLTLSYHILHCMCFSPIHFDLDWLGHGPTCGPFVTYSTEKHVQTRQLFYSLIEDQNSHIYIEQSIKLIEDYLPKEVLVNILETAQQGGCFSHSSLLSWLDRK